MGFIVVLLANTVNDLCYAAKKQQYLLSSLHDTGSWVDLSVNNTHISVSHTGDNNIKPSETIPYDLACSDNAMHNACALLSQRVVQVGLF